MSIPLVKTFMPAKEKLLPRLTEVLYSGYIGQGEIVEQFESKLCDFLSAKHCLTVNSGSSALHIALILAGVGPGDEVISTVLTAEPTNTVISQTGATIVWADIDFDTGNLCPEDVERKISSKTKAIVVVDYAGVPVDIKRFQALEKKYGIPIIEDAAHAFGASFDGKKLGSHFSFVAFSFQAIKHLTTVDGGLLCIRDEELYEKAKIIRWFGLDKKIARQLNNISIQGYKYHMNNVNACIGIVQLEEFDTRLSAYVSNGRYYDNELKNIKDIELLKYYESSNPSYWLYTLKVKRREDFINKLKQNGIEASPLHKRNDVHHIFRYSKAHLPNVDRFELEWVHIPCGPWVGESEREMIASVIKECW